MVTEVKKKKAIQYLKQSEEFLASSKDNLKSGRNNASGFNAAQSMINANDALTLYFLGRRASRDHSEAIKLHIDVVKIINDSSWRKKLKESLDMRSNAGYTGSNISKTDAEKLVRYAAQFIGWVRNYLKA